jgi:hypothetical protein
MEPNIFQTSAVSLLTGRLNRDMLSHASGLNMEEIRGLVDSYYQVQELRKASGNQRRAVSQGKDANPLIDYVVDHLLQIEKDIQRMMDVATDAHVPAKWARSFVGVGPVLAAGLLAHIDVKIAKTGSSVWRYAGLDPTVTWAKGQRRPFNARLKVLAFKIGDSFKKFSNHRHASLYSRLYRERKALELARSEGGLQAETAAALLATKRWKPDTAAARAYRDGKLPAGQLDARARRYAVKMFLEHFFKVCYEVEFGKPAPLPYITEHDPVTHGPGLLPMPHWPEIPDKSAALRHEEEAVEEEAPPEGGTTDEAPTPEELVQRRRRRKR